MRMANRGAGQIYWAFENCVKSANASSGSDIMEFKAVKS